MSLIDKNNQRLTIRSNWDLGMIENVLLSTLPNCRIWGDLNTSHQEADNILKRIRKELSPQPSFVSFKKLINSYPAVFITDMTNFILFEYDNNNFWDSWANRMDMTLTAVQQAEIGRLVRKTLEIFDFRIIRDEGYINVSTLLYQAGIPGISYNKLFDILDSTLNTQYIQPQDIINEITGYRSFLVDVSVRRFFEDYDKGTEIIQALRDMMIELGDISDRSELPEAAGIPERIIEQYYNWCVNLGQGSRKQRITGQYYLSPKLSHEETKGLCLLLPGQNLRNDSVYRLRWEIFGKNPDFSKSLYQDIQSKDHQNLTFSSYVPVPPAATYQIFLFDDDRDESPLTDSWTIQGLDSESSLLVFSSSGLAVEPSQVNLSRQGCTFVYNREQVTFKHERSVIKEELYLQREWSNCSAYRFFAIEQDASLEIHTPHGMIHFDYQRTYDFELSSIGTLFDEPYPCSVIPVYTRFPDLTLMDVDFSYDQPHSGWQIVLINRTLKRKNAIEIEELSRSHTVDSIEFALADWAKDKFSNEPGLYEIRLYQGTVNRRHANFYFVPPIRYMAQIESLRSDRQDCQTQAVLYVHRDDFPLLELDETVKTQEVLRNGTNWVELRPMTKGSKLMGFVTLSDQLRVPFQKTVRDLEWRIWNEQADQMEPTSTSKSFYPKDLQSAIWRLKIHFTDPNTLYDTLRIQLEQNDGNVLQGKDLTLDQQQNCYVTLNHFQDTMNHYPLPQRLVLRISSGYDDFHPILIASLVSFVHLQNPKYLPYKDQHMIAWLHNPDNDFSNHELKLIPLHDPDKPIIQRPLSPIVSKKNTAGKKYQGIVLSDPLPNGVYHIDTVDKNEFSFFDDAKDDLPPFDLEHLLIVNGDEYLSQHFKSNTKEVDHWLAAARVAESKETWIESLLSELTKSIKVGNWQFDPAISARLLFSLTLSTSDQSDLAAASKRSVQAILRLINDHIITNGQRTILLHNLLESTLDESNIGFIIRELQLYLFSPDGKTCFDRSLLYRAWNVDDRLAILINLRGSSANPTIDIDRVVTHIGDEALPKLLSFNTPKNCGSEQFVECFECLVANHGGCPDVSFQNSPRVWGDGSEYVQLFVNRKNDFYFREPKPEDTLGYEILGKSYLKLYYDAVLQNGKNLNHYSKAAQDEFRIIDDLSSKYRDLLTEIEQTLKLRCKDTHNHYFYYNARAAILTGLSNCNHISHHEIQPLLRFWRHSEAACPELVYRDLILAELYSMTLRRQ